MFTVSNLSCLRSINFPHFLLLYHSKNENTDTHLSLWSTSLIEDFVGGDFWKFPSKIRSLDAEKNRVSIIKITIFFAHYYCFTWLFYFSGVIIGVRRSCNLAFTRLRDREKESYRGSKYACRQCADASQQPPL